MTGQKEEKLRISVIIPAYHEGNGIGTVVSNIRAVLEKMETSFEIIVVDDGSKDVTAKNAGKAGARVLQHPYNIGNGAAIKTGIRHARGSILVTIDADGQHNPEDIPLLVNRIGAYDMVVGSRR